MEKDLYDFLLKLPKVELHNHVEGGAMYPDLVLKFGKRNCVPLPFENEQGAERFYQFTSLDQFIHILRTTTATLHTAEDYAEAIERQGAEAAKQNIIYHELFLTYGLVSRRGVAWEALVEGVEEGVRLNAERHGVQTAIIVDLDRTLPEDVALQHVKLAARDHDRISAVGIGLDCQENGYPAHRLRRAFDLAVSEGFRLTAHAGEDGGAESVWDALGCGVERIDHGVQSIDDPKLLKELATKEILLTVCPISNIKLHVFPEMEQHSLPQLLEAGVQVCVNSDDPPMFDCNLMAELVAIEDAFSLGKHQLIALLRNAIEYSFLAEGAKAELLNRFDLAAAS